MNLPAAWDPPNNGRDIELTGHIEPRAPGVSVTFNAVSHASNESAAPNSTLSTSSATTGSNGEASVRLQVPFYGGAKYMVGGQTPDMAQPVLSGEITIWRKVFYHITEMDPSPEPVWSCDERNCPGHANRRDRCASGVWHCNRTQPACPGHSSHRHHCREGNSWTCGARDCPGHAGRSDKCESGIWHCTIQSPSCPGHSSHRHRCAPDPSISLTAPSDMISALRSVFDRVFFQLERGATHHGTTPYQAHLTASQRSSLESSLRSSVQDTRSPFKMNIVMCDRADIVAEQTWLNASTTANVQTPYFQKWPHDPVVIQSQYQTATGTWAALTHVNTPANPSNADQIRVTATIPGFTTGSTVNVRIRYRYQRGTAGGWGGTTGTLFMCIGRQRRANPRSPSGADLQQALTHETGHALGLVPNTASWRDTDPRDAPYSLKHCGYQDSSSTPRCVMWFQLGGTGPRLQFCSSNAPNDCAHFLYRTDYSTISWI